MRALRPRRSYSWAIGALALVLALGGGSALALSGQNTVRSDDIVNGQVKAADIGDGAVTAPKVKDGSLQPVDFKYAVAGAKSTGPVVTDNTFPGANVPLKGNTWTQPPAEIRLLSGLAKVTRPQACTQDFMNGQFGDAFVQLSLDGKYGGGGFANLGMANPGQTITVPIFFQPLSVPAYSTPTKHTLTAAARDTCKNAGENWTVKAIKVNMAAIR